MTAPAAAVVLAACLGAGSPDAATATTWTVKPGGKFSATNVGHITIRDTKTGVVILCKPSSLSGKLKSGSGLPGARIGSITKLSFSTCTGPGGIVYTETMLASKKRPWHMNANSYSNGVAHGSITGVRGTMSGFGCTATIAGRTPATPARVETKYTNSTHKLKIVTSGSTLHFYNVSAGCVGLWNTGDHMTISGTYTVTPAQTISSP